MHTHACQRKRARMDRSGADEILTLAVVRTCGDKCLEMPFVVTPPRHRRKGTDMPSAAAAHDGHSGSQGYSG